jgi:hypothetical protein
LILDDERRVVRRVGINATVDLSHSNLLWGIFKSLKTSRDTVFPNERLWQVWEKYGRAEEPEVSTIDGAMSDLRNELRPLKVDIKSDRNVGRRLIDAKSRQSDKRQQTAKRRRNRKRPS